MPANMIAVKKRRRQATSRNVAIELDHGPTRWKCANGRCPLGSIADICSVQAHVRFVPKADMPPARSHHFKINPGVIALWQRRTY